MIKAKPARPKSSKGGDGGAETSSTTDKPKGGGGGAANSANAATKKRRPSQKKKETSEDPPSSSSSAKKPTQRGGILSAASLHQEEHRRYYQRAPRLLPDIDGVQALTSSEIQSDLKLLHSSLSAFEGKLHALLPPGASAGGGLYLHGNKQPSHLSLDDAYEFMFQNSSGGGRRARHNGVITPEEVVESLPVCRRAVRITQRELAAMKRERDDLERDFMRQRCKLLWQLGEMKRIRKQQDSVLRTLGETVVRKAKSLESSRRRTNALQDIMNELDVRGATIARLTKDKQRADALLKAHGIAVPESDEVWVGDHVDTSFGKGVVAAVDVLERRVTVKLESGGEAFLQADQEGVMEVLPSPEVYTEVEKEMKQKLFDKVGALVQSNSAFSVLSSGGGGGGARRRSRGAHDDSDADMDDGLRDDSEEDDDEDDDDEEDEDDEDDEDDDSTRMDGDGDDKRVSKKRKLVALPTAGMPMKKRSKNAKVFDFTAGKLPITPYDCGLLLSPLSVLPERVSAVADVELQWMSAYLPVKMAQWEEERYEALRMQGEIERLRFQLQQAEAEKEDAHALAVEQVDSMNDLVRQMEKLREQQSSSKDSKDKDASSTDSCPNCSGATGAKKTSTTTTAASAKATKANGKPTGKPSNRRQRGESMSGADEEEDTTSTDKPQGHETPDEGHHDEDEFGDEGGESSDGTSKPAARSLRPRRSSGAASSSSSSTSAGGASTSNGPSKSAK